MPESISEHSMKNTTPETITKETAVISSEQMSAKASLIAGLLAGLTASACCAGPLILLMLGVSGSWIGNLSALEPFRPIFIILAVALLYLAYRRIFVKAQNCSVDAVCATTSGQKTQKTLFWITAVVILLSISFPWYGTWLLDV